jgi:hypothetical protein
VDLRVPHPRRFGRGFLAPLQLRERKALAPLVLACDGQDVHREDAGEPTVDAGRAPSSVACPDLWPTAPRFEEARWSDAFTLPGTDGPIGDYAVRGDEVLLGGEFAWAGPVPARFVARWTPDGGVEALGTGLAAAAVAVAFGPDGRPYAATRGAVYRYDSDRWVELGRLVEPGFFDRPRALVFEDGDLLVGGAQ